MSCAVEHYLTRSFGETGLLDIHLSLGEDFDPGYTRYASGDDEEG